MSASRLAIYLVVFLTAFYAPTLAAPAQPVKWGAVLADDYDRGVAQHKPIVVLFYDIRTSRTEADLLAGQISLSAALQKVADAAAWSFVNVSGDLAATNIAKALGITTFPTISVLRPEANKLDETVRIVGVMPIASTETVILRGIETAKKP